MRHTYDRSRRTEAIRAAEPDNKLVMRLVVTSEIVAFGDLAGLDERALASKVPHLYNPHATPATSQIRQ